MAASLRRVARRSSSGASGAGTTFRYCAWFRAPTIAVTKGCGRSRSKEPKSCPKPVRAIVSRVSFVMSPGTSTARPAVTSPVPVVREPPGHGQHHRVVAGHRVAAETGGEDVVRQLPVGLVVVRREQPVPGDRTQVGHPEAHMLGEARLVRQVGGEIRAPHEHDLLAERPAPEDRSQAQPDPHRVLEGCPGTDTDQVAEQRDPVRRTRDAVQLRPAQLGTAESPGRSGPGRRLGHDAISLDAAAC